MKLRKNQCGIRAIYVYYIIVYTYTLNISNIDVILSICSYEDFYK